MAHSHLAEILDLDTVVLADFHREVIGWIGSLLPPRPHIVDLGAGTGAGTIALARLLPEADIVAVDADPDMLAHLRSKAAGLTVRTVQADLDGAWPDLGPADLVWASASMHHFADPHRTLTEAYRILRPGGRIAITELDSFPMFLPGAVALEERMHAELARMRTEHGMHMDEDWTARLTAAGFTVEADRRFDLDLRPPLPPETARYAELSLTRMRHGLTGRIDEHDLEALDRATADALATGNLRVRTVRTVWTAVTSTAPPVS